MSGFILPDNLSKRERQVMEIIMRRGKVTGRDIQDDLPDPPTYSAVRSILRILVEKNLIQKKRINRRDWYSFLVPAAEAKVSALRNFVSNFFSNSVGEAACALLGQKNLTLSAEEATRLKKLIKDAQTK